VRALVERAADALEGLVHGPAAGAGGD